MQGKVKVTLFDGGVQEAEGALFGLADRVAFERHFRVPAAKMSDIERWVYMEDDPEVQADPSLKGHIKPGGEEFREEWLVFFAYRLLRRSGVAADEYDVWLEKVDDVDITFGTEAPNPTAIDTPPTDSPS